MDIWWGVGIDFCFFTLVMFMMRRPAKNATRAIDVLVMKGITLPVMEAIICNVPGVVDSVAQSQYTFSPPALSLLTSVNV